MMRQTELGREFKNGGTGGKASNVHIEDFPNLGMTALIGYGHAVYATRDKETGHIIYYQGWLGYSPSTSSQLARMGLAVASDEVTDSEKSRGTLRRAEKEARRDATKETTVTNAP